MRSVWPNNRDNESMYFSRYRTINLVITRSVNLSSRAENSHTYVRAVRRVAGALD